MRSKTPIEPVETNVAQAFSLLKSKQDARATGSVTLLKPIHLVLFSTLLLTSHKVLESVTLMRFFYTTPGIMAVLCGLCALFVWMERRWAGKFFTYAPALIWIYLFSTILSSWGVIPNGDKGKMAMELGYIAPEQWRECIELQRAAKDQPTPPAIEDIFRARGILTDTQLNQLETYHRQLPYPFLKTYLLPLFLVLLLIPVDLQRIWGWLGRSFWVMLMGSLGMVVGGVVSYSLVHRHLPPESWKAFGALAGSWIGGTGNMAAVAGALKTPGELLGMAILTDAVIYALWIPLLLAVRDIGKGLERWLAKSSVTASLTMTLLENESAEVKSYHWLYLLALAMGVIAVASWVVDILPPGWKGTVMTSQVWHLLFLTSLALALSFTPARQIPGGQPLATALIYLFLASMGAQAQLSDWHKAHWFLLAGLIWISIHGIFCLLGARLWRMDLATAAIASAANIGAIASAPIVAAYHRRELVPLAVLMAIMGYALGNYLAILTAQICLLVG